MITSWGVMVCTIILCLGGVYCMLTDDNTTDRISQLIMVVYYFGVANIVLRYMYGW